MISKSKFYIYFLRNYSRFKAFIWFVTGEVMRLICGALVAQSFVFKWTKSRFLGILQAFFSRFSKLRVVYELLREITNCFKKADY